MQVFCFKFFLPSHNVGRALQYFFEFASNAVGLVALLGTAIYGDNQSVQTRLYGLFCILLIKVVRIGRSGCINPSLGGVSNHLQELRMQIRLSLKVKGKVHECLGQLIYYLLIEVLAKHTRRPCKGAQAAGAFGAAQIARGSRLKSNADRQTSVLCLAATLGAIVAV